MEAGGRRDAAAASALCPAGAAAHPRGEAGESARPTSLSRFGGVAQVQLALFWRATNQKLWTCIAFDKVFGLCLEHLRNKHTKKHSTFENPSVRAMAELK